MAIVSGNYPSVIPATATDLVARAYALPDLTGSLHITHDDVFRSVNECWKEVYNNLVASDQDYFIKEVVCAFSTTWQTNTTGPWEYFIDFSVYCPDHMKTRFVEWNNNPNWIPMNKYNADNKGMQAPYPMYHERNNGLLIISGMLSNSISSVRIGYIPNPVIITVPDQPISFGLSYSAANFQNISQAFYASYTGVSTYDCMIYVYNNTQLTIETNQNSVSGQTGTPFSLYTAGYTIAGTYWYKGYLYWISAAGNLYYNALDLTSPTAFTAPTQVMAAAGCLFIHIFNNIVWVGTSTGIYQQPFLGTAFTLWAAVGSTCVQVLNSNVYYIDGSNTLWFNPGLTYSSVNKQELISTSTVLDLANDNTNLYVLDTSNKLWVYTPSVTGTTCTLGSATLLTTDVSTQIAAWQNYRLPILTQEGQTLTAMSAYVNYTFQFPSNVIYDIFCYQLAADFCRKQKDQDRMVLMESRLDDLKKTYQSSQFRDTYRPPRTRHVNVTKPYGLI